MFFLHNFYLFFYHNCFIMKMFLYFSVWPSFCMFRIVIYVCFEVWLSICLSLSLQLLRSRGKFVLVFLAFLLLISPLRLYANWYWRRGSKFLHPKISRIICFNADPKRAKYWFERSLQPIWNVTLVSEKLELVDGWSVFHPPNF